MILHIHIHHLHVILHTHYSKHTSSYGVPTISRLLKIIGRFCKRALKKRLYSAKETYSFNEPTNHSHPIHTHIHHPSSDTHTHSSSFTHTNYTDIRHPIHTHIILHTHIHNPSSYTHTSIIVHTHELQRHPSCYTCT